MALIRHGSIDDFSFTMNGRTEDNRSIPAKTGSFRVLAESTKKIEAPELTFEESAERRGLGLKAIKLLTGFEGFLNNIFESKNDVYFIAWAWDMSGKPVHFYPSVNAAKEDVVIPLKVGKLRHFIGEGINLFPARKVKAGLSVRIQIWESDQKTRDFGKTLRTVSETIQQSELNALLQLISVAGGIPLATVGLVKDAAIELGKLVGKVLESNSDDYVDFYEGHYPASSTWETKDDQYEGNASEIILSRFS
ncbi:MAG: hypothetical protein KDD67_14515 [Ignavibacteriae bacterium]|nr:hypothetical protein [Ignavibacteriota bacterium]MCB9215178.1 hypothetical protein [Ignavibacteria bacterium]